MKDALIVSLLSIAPRKTGARSMGWIARRRLSRLLTRAFVRAYDVDLSEAEHPLEHYPTLEALFTRRLKPGARPIAGGDGVLVSPVDGTCAAVGRTHDGRIAVAPGKALVLPDLLGEEPGGERDVAVLYLSPRDYHRVHVPFEGTATRWRYLPGTLWPVFPAAVRRVDGLFARNERVVVHTDTDCGPLTAVLVGAFGVGRITLSLCDLVTNSGGAAAAAALQPPLPVRRGAELGVFHLGSTVVLAAPPGRWTWTVRAGDPLRVGQPIASAVRQLAEPADADA